jgi:hypothetical protein
VSGVKRIVVVLAAAALVSLGAGQASAAGRDDGPKKPPGWHGHSHIGW